MAQDDTSEKLRSLTIDRSDDEPARRGVSPVLVGVLVVAFSVVSAFVAWRLAPSGETTLAAAPSPNGASSAATSASEPGAAPAPARRAGRLIASGYVTARRQATVSSDITGRILEVYVEEGAVVEEKQILARLDDIRAQIALEQSKALAAAADAASDGLASDLAEARRDLARVAKLKEREFSAEAAVNNAQAVVDSLAAQLRRARANAENARLEVTRQEDLVERHLVRAPFSGVVVGKNAQAGEIVSPTSAGGGFTRTGIYTLVDMASLEIEVDVSEQSIERVKAGQPVEAILDAYPDWRIPAHVEAIIPTADRSRATIQVRVAFDELDPRILPEMAAKVTFLDAEAG